jgi:cholesterol transport system auxiliary component
MLYSTTRYQQNSYAYSRWSDAPVKLLPLLFQTTLEATGSFGAVIGSPSSAKADFLLESTLTDFSLHIHDGNTSEGVIGIRFYLINTATKTVTAAREFHSQIPASAPNAGDGAAALNQAADTVAHDLAAWLGGMQL